MINKTDMHRVNMCQLDLAVEVKRICDKYNFTYFLTGGTLKGAVLKKGFLEGDGDIDIGMPRNDYEAFIRICSEELPEKYYIQNYHTDLNFGFLYSKIRINGTEYIEKNAQNVKINKGIFIDVYPFDTMPENSFFQTVQRTIHRFLKGLLMKRTGYITRHNLVIVNFIFSFINRLFTAQQLYKLADKNLKHRYATGGSKIAALEGGHGYKENLDKRDLSNMTNIMFEGVDFKAPKNYMCFLKNIYGDNFLTDTKVKDNHNIVHISFGTYIPVSEREING